MKYDRFEICFEVTMFVRKTLLLLYTGLQIIFVGSSSRSAVQVDAQEIDRTSLVNATISTVNDDVHRSRGQIISFSNNFFSFP